MAFRVVVGMEDLAVKNRVATALTVVVCMVTGVVMGGIHLVFKIRVGGIDSRNMMSTTRAR